MNQAVIRSLVGRKVSVYSMVSSGSARDDGVVQSYDDQCLVLEKGNDVLVFVIANIRLIKVLE
jgi:hypothetical protein